MKDYWLTQYFLQATGIGILLICLVAISLALWLPKTRKGKGIALAAVLIAMLVPIAQMYERAQVRKAGAAERKQRYEAAKAHFEERCKTAGEKIYKTVEGVEGIQLWGMREGDPAKNAANPDWQAAAMPKDATGIGYIERFLEWEHKSTVGGERGYLNSWATNAFAAGYRFVDVQQGDRSYLRYRINTEPHKTAQEFLIKEAIASSSARYAVKYEDVSTPEDRAQWIAGVRVAVIDTESGGVLAEMRAYAFEAGFGSRAGARMPWQFAKTCKASQGEKYQSTRFFVDRVLKPLQGS